MIAFTVTCRVREPEPITAEGAMRYADPVLDERRNRLICIREDHTPAGEPKHTIVAVHLDGDEYGTALLIRLISPLFLR